MLSIFLNVMWILCSTANGRLYSPILVDTKLRLVQVVLWLLGPFWTTFLHSGQREYCWIRFGHCLEKWSFGWPQLKQLNPADFMIQYSCELEDTIRVPFFDRVTFFAFCISFSFWMWENEPDASKWSTSIPFGRSPSTYGVSNAAVKNSLYLLKLLTTTTTT